MVEKQFVLLKEYVFICYSQTVTNGVLGPAEVVKCPIKKHQYKYERETVTGSMWSSTPRPLLDPAPSPGTPAPTKGSHLKQICASSVQWNNFDTLLTRIITLLLPAFLKHVQYKNFKTLHLSH